MMRRHTGRCWPAGSRTKHSWQVTARGGAGHASATWREWMEPVRPNPRGMLTDENTWEDAARIARECDEES